jgi:hypothetical protein
MPLVSTRLRRLVGVAVQCRDLADIYLCGYGEWAAPGSRNLFVQLPRNTRVVVYTVPGQFLWATHVHEVLRAGKDARSPVQVFTEYQSVPDATLDPAPELRTHFITAALARRLHVEMFDVPKTLGQLLKRFGGHDLHWLPCRA